MNAPESFYMFLFGIDPMASVGDSRVVPLPRDRAVSIKDFEVHFRGLIRFSLDLVRPQAELPLLRDYLRYIEANITAPGELMRLWRESGARLGLEPEEVVRWFIQLAIEDLDHRLGPRN